MERLQKDEIRTIPLLNDLSQDTRDVLLTHASTRQFARGSTICLQDEKTRTLKILLHGWLKLYRVAPNGREAVLSTLRTSQSFDEIAALQNGPSLASAEAITDCKVLFIPIAQNPTDGLARQEIYSAAVAAASQHLDRMATHIEGLKVQTGLQRLSVFLIDLCGDSCGADRLELPYGKSVLAGKLGMKPESLSRAFNRLRDVGVNSELRHVDIKDVSALRSFAEDISACA